MTKLFIALSMLTLSLFPSHFDAGDKGKKKAAARASEEANARLTNAHEAMFGAATSARWTTTRSGNWRANFNWEGESVSAFYAPNGTYIAHTIRRQVTELPLKLRVALHQKFQPSAIAEVIELFSPEDTAWFIRVKNGKQTEIYKAYAYGKIIRHHTPLP